MVGYKGGCFCAQAEDMGEWSYTSLSFLSSLLHVLAASLLTKINALDIFILHDEDTVLPQNIKIVTH